MASDEMIDWLKENEGYLVEIISDEERSAYAAMDGPVRSILGLAAEKTQFEDIKSQNLVRSEQNRRVSERPNARFGRRMVRGIAVAAALLLIISFGWKYLARQIHEPEIVNGDKKGGNHKSNGAPTLTPQEEQLVKQNPQPNVPGSLPRKIAKPSFEAVQMDLWGEAMILLDPKSVHIPETELAKRRELLRNRIEQAKSDYPGHKEDIESDSMLAKAVNPSILFNEPIVKSNNSNSKAGMPQVNSGKRPIKPDTQDRPKQ